MPKIVTIGLRLNEDFIRMLGTNLTLRGVLSDDEDKFIQPSVLEALGIAVLGEARGAHATQTYMKLTPMWRSHIEIVEEARKVEEEQ